MENGFFGQQWPLYIAIYIVKWTICWNTNYSYLDTLFISGIAFLVIKYPNKVKNIGTLVYQPVTNNNISLYKDMYNLVGTSETIRPLSLTRSINSDSNSEVHWNQWLAGLIDGDGNLLISKAGYASCEITMGLEDEYALSQIKQKLGGSIKLRSGVKAIRYRLHNKEGMINLIHRINGHIRHSGRLIQFKIMCNNLNINSINPEEITINNGWFTGFFDADGTVTYSFKNSNPQLTISVSNKLEMDIKCFKTVFGGNIYYDKSGYGYFKWSVQNRPDIDFFLNYLKTVPSKSYKRQRLFLIPKYYELKNLKAYTASPESLQYKAWTQFERKWKEKG